MAECSVDGHLKFKSKCHQARLAISWFLSNWCGASLTRLRQSSAADAGFWRENLRLLDVEAESARLCVEVCQESKVHSGAWINILSGLSLWRSAGEYVNEVIDCWSWLCSYMIQRQVESFTQVPTTTGFTISVRRVPRGPEAGMNWLLSCSWGQHPFVWLQLRNTNSSKVALDQVDDTLKFHVYRHFKSRGFNPSISVLNRPLMSL